MNPSFQDLIELYRESEKSSDRRCRVFKIKTQEDLCLLNKLVSEDSYDIYALDVDGELEVGAKITLTFAQPDLKFGRLHESVREYISADLVREHGETPYYIEQEDVASFDDNKNDIIVNYEIVKSLLKQLTAMASYKDTVNNKLIFFSKKTFELSYGIGGNEVQESFIKLLMELETEQKEMLMSFNQWLKDEGTSGHMDEKGSILAFVLSDVFSQKANVVEVVSKISHISEAAQAQYALYLENFSYEKFVKKLEDNNEKFVDKINETVNKVLPQFLGLPFLTAIPSALKSQDNLIVYLGLFFYCFMCYLALRDRRLVLEHIQTDVENFEKNGKIPGKLKDQWKKDKARIGVLIKNQIYLYRLLVSVVLLCWLYSFDRIVFHSVNLYFDYYC